MAFFTGGEESRCPKFRETPPRNPLLEIKVVFVRISAIVVGPSSNPFGEGAKLPVKYRIAAPEAADFAPL
jgi:hypothetical protein